MEKATRWYASWTNHTGRARGCIFRGPETLFLARLDFQLKLIDQGEKIPNAFELEEYSRRRAQNWNAPGKEETLEMPIVSHCPPRTRTPAKRAEGQRDERTASPGREQ